MSVTPFKKLDQEVHKLFELAPRDLSKLEREEVLSELVYISCGSEEYLHPAYVVLDKTTERPLIQVFPDGVVKVQLLWQSTGRLEWFPQDAIRGPVVDSGRPKRTRHAAVAAAPAEAGGESKHSKFQKKVSSSRNKFSDNMIEPLDVDDRRKVEALIPDTIKEKFGMQGYAKLDGKGDKFYPVFVLGPYHLHGEAQDLWLLNMKLMHDKGSSLEKLKLIVLFYGEEDPSRECGLVWQRNFVPFLANDDRIQRVRHDIEVAKIRKNGGIVKLSSEEEFLLRGIAELEKDSREVPDLLRDPKGHTIRLEEVTPLPKTKRQKITPVKAARQSKTSPSSSETNQGVNSGRTAQGTDPNIVQCNHLLSEVLAVLKQFGDVQQVRNRTTPPSEIQTSEAMTVASAVGDDSTWLPGDSLLLSEEEQSEEAELESTTPSATQYNYRPSLPKARLNNLGRLLMENSLNILNGDDDDDDSTTMPPPTNSKPLQIRLSLRGKQPRVLNTSYDELSTYSDGNHEDK